MDIAELIDQFGSGVSGAAGLIALWMASRADSKRIKAEEEEAKRQQQLEAEQVPFPIKLPKEEARKRFGRQTRSYLWRSLYLVALAVGLSCYSQLRSTAKIDALEKQLLESNVALSEANASKDRYEEVLAAIVAPFLDPQVLMSDPTGGATDALREMLLEASENLDGKTIAELKLEMNRSEEVIE